jgi:hypothetical protein
MFRIITLIGAIRNIFIEDALSFSQPLNATTNALRVLDAVVL